MSGSSPNTCPRAGGVRAALALSVCVGLSASACTGILDRASRVTQVLAPTASLAVNTAVPVATLPTPEHATPMQVILPDETGEVVTGRVVDGVTGLPVRDAGVALLGLNRRTITAPDGGFRFDGVPSGSLTVVLGPVEDYVPRGVDARIDPGSGDLGTLALLPAGPPTLIVPEYGGFAAGCPGSRLAFATDAVAEPTVIRVTCLENERASPAPPPVGRLPLAILDLSPGALVPAGVVQLTAGLPDQPRFSSGVALDVLRLDLNRMIWVPDSTLTVDAGGTSATGRIAALGTYMIAAPPFGVLSGTADEPTVTQFRIADSVDGMPSDALRTGLMIVYATFEYAGMENTPITVRTTSADDRVVFEQRRPYAGLGRDNVPMVHERGAWPEGRYVTTIYTGDPLVAVHSITWRVTSEPTPAPVEPSPPPAAPYGDAATGPAGPLPAPQRDCVPPWGWYAYLVQPGDTLAVLAARTSTTVEALVSANCLASTWIRAGSVLYLPQPPIRHAAPAVPTWPSAGRSATAWAPPPAWPTQAPTPTGSAAGPTPWWPPTTEPWSTPSAPPPKPSPVAATVAPRPTIPPEPTAPPEPPAAPTPEPPTVAPPTEAAPPEEPIATDVPPEPPIEEPRPGEQPTAKWPTLPPETPAP